MNAGRWKLFEVRWCRVVAGAVVAGVAGGCWGPDYNAISNRLRAENIQQRNQIAALNDTLKNKDATIQDLRTRLNGNFPPLQTLPAERLAEVFTVGKLEIQSQTDTYDLDGKGVSAFRVFLRTLTEDNQIVPAAGALTIEAFELPATPGEPRRIGTWTFTADQMKKSWYTGLGLNHFALNCPWQSPPTQAHVIFQARMQDALTGNTLQAQLDKKISPLPVK